MMNAELFEESQKYFPDGVNSPSHSFRTVGGSPLFPKSAKGAYITDAEGNRFLDLQNSSTILGHSHPLILEAIQKQLHNSFSTGTPTELEIELAKFIIGNFQNIDKIKFFYTESEACSNAVKLARSITTRNKILKFSGCYHGDSESLLKDSGAGNSLIESLNSSGIPKEVSDQTLVSEFNNIENLGDIFRIHSESIAAVIIEPVAANMGCVPAEKPFLEKIRELCDEHNTILILDETKTGFRIAFGGAQEIFGINADLVVFGNNIGGGFSLAAIGGNEKIMNHFASFGKVFAEGIPLVNTLAFAAGNTTLNYIKNTPDFYLNLNKKAEILDFGIGKILNSKGIAHRINRRGSMMSVFFHVHKVSDFQDAMNSNVALFNNFFHYLLKNKIFLPPHALKSWFVSDAFKENHTDYILDTLQKFEYS